MEEEEDHLAGGARFSVGANQWDHQLDVSGGAPDEVTHTESSGEALEPVTVHSPATRAGGSGTVVSDADSVEMDLDVDSDHEGLVKMRNLQDIYQNSMEVTLSSDSDIEAMLAVMEEPSCFKDAVGSSEWKAAMDSVPLIKTKHGSCRSCQLGIDPLD